MLRTATTRKPGVFPTLAVIMMAAFWVTSCSAQPADSQDISKPNPQLRTVTLKAGPVQLIAEVADTEGQRNRGLMLRESLADGKGMLFVFDLDQKVSFWMKNTSIPLSVAYMGSDGTILQILDLVPFSLEPRPSERSIRYALEVPQGWFGRAGLKIGDKFVIPPLR